MEMNKERGIHGKGDRKKEKGRTGEGKRETERLYFLFIVFFALEYRVL